MEAIRVLLVDDSPDFLESASGFLSRHTRIHVVGCARGGEEGVRLARELTPDVVLMDWAMLDLDGLQATRRIKARPPAPRVVIVTFYEEAELRAAATDAGADAVVGKSQFTDDVISVIETLGLWRQIEPRSVSEAGGGEVPS